MKYFLLHFIVQAYIGSLVTLTCIVSGTPLFWYVVNDNIIRTLTDNHVYEGTRTSSLKIKSITSNTEGLYHCQPQNATKGPEITVSILGECFIHKYAISYVIKAFYIYLYLVSVQSIIPPTH